MNDVSAIAQQTLNSLSISNQQKDEGEELGKDAFLRLMIAQLQNQDPLSPAKNEDFIAQLAQFSTVEGIENMNTSLGELASSFRSSQALEASALVGRQVLVPGDIATLLPGRLVQGSINLPTSSQNVNVTIEGLNGEIIQTINLEQQPRGDITFGWDGTNQSGELVAPGAYRVKATGIIDGEATDLAVSIGANVNSVTIGQNDEMILNVEGVGPVPFGDVGAFL